MRCEGWRRYGGAFTLGPVEWRQCENAGEVMIKFKDNQSGSETKGQVRELAACKACWQECIDNKLDIKSVTPINPREEE